MEIVCAGADPTLFDVFADIVIPSFVGLGTLVLGIAALVATIRATQITTKLTRDQMATDDKSRRQRVIALVEDWFVTNLPRAISGDPAPPAHTEMYRAVTIALSEFPEARPFVAELSEFISGAEKTMSEARDAAKTAYEQAQQDSEFQQLLVQTSLTGMELLERIRTVAEDPSALLGKSGP